MIKRTLVKHALQATESLGDIRVEGWVRTRRDAKSFSFVEINDGTSLASLQVIIDAKLPTYETHIGDLSTGAAVRVMGMLTPSQGKNQSWEIVATSFEVIGRADASYPLQKKGHSAAFLRDIAHLRPRSNLFGCVFRIRSRLAHAIHQFFQDRDFVNIHTPIITASDCEGAGEMFRVTTIDPNNPPMKDGNVDYNRDFFEQPSYLTVSGQLAAEAFACSLSNVYTFGPTFRAENSNTSRHASEFWMIEPEMAFCDLAENMDLAEGFIKHLISDILEQCPAEMHFFAKFVDKDLLNRLKAVVDQPFQRLTYEEAVKILEQSGHSFEYPVSYGSNLQSEHERFLTEKHFKCPVTVFNYPKTIKPFYMRANADGVTVAAMDVLVPGIGEIIGGSQREERLGILEQQLEHHKLNKENYWWYLELRRFGTVPHSGFGLGFERMLMFLTGISNIRDVIPFARTPGSAEF
jgi:asparaginyl-tRNA synthetase